VSLDEVWFRYEKTGPDVVKGLSLKAYPGEFLCIIGGNGTGKTTALSQISGMNQALPRKVKNRRRTIAACSRIPKQFV
jgi:energy-coupling factor transport system ATP-binding protein